MLCLQPDKEKKKTRITQTGDRRREEGMREKGRDQMTSGDHKRMMAAALYAFF